MVQPPVAALNMSKTDVCIYLHEDVNISLGLALVLADLLCHQPGLGLEDVLAALAVPHEDSQARVEEEHEPGQGMKVDQG